MSITDRLAKTFLKQAQIVSKTVLAENVFHLTIEGKDLLDLPYNAGEHLRVFIGYGSHLSFRDKIRTYSIWKYDAIKGRIDMAVCAHTQGPGSAWIRAARPGQALFLSSPQGKFTADPSASYYLFVGDATALAHLYEIRRDLPEGISMKGIIYAPHKAQLFADIDGSLPFEFYELDENPGEKLIPLIEKFIDENSGEGMAYVGGDGRVCVSLNNYLRKTKNWKSKNIKTKPFWMPGKTGLE